MPGCELTGNPFLFWWLNQHICSLSYIVSKLVDRSYFPMADMAESPFCDCLLTWIPGELVFISTHTIQSLVTGYIKPIKSYSFIGTINYIVMIFTRDCSKYSTYTYKHLSEIVDDCRVYSVTCSLFCRLSLSQYAWQWLTRNPFLF